MFKTGLIAAASGQLDGLLKKESTKTGRLGNGTSSITTARRYVNVNSKKNVNGSLDGIYTNGNGLHA